MDPIDHSYALAALERYHEADLRRCNNEIARWEAQMEELGDLLSGLYAQRDDYQLQLASIRSLAATIKPSAVMQ